MLLVKNVKKDIFELKCDKLIFFKDVVSKIEIIYDRMSILRSKGYNLQIEIKIETDKRTALLIFSDKRESVIMLSILPPSSG